jgi:hypothetical protein
MLESMRVVRSVRRLGEKKDLFMWGFIFTVPERTFHLRHWMFDERMVGHRLLQLKGCLGPEAVLNPQTYARRRMASVGGP